MDNETVVNANTLPAEASVAQAQSVALAAVVPSAQHNRIATYYVGQASVQERLLPESRNALVSLHAVAQAAGFDTQLEAFIDGLKPHALMSDSIPSASVAASKVLTETKKGQFAVASTESTLSEEIEASALEFDGEALLDSYLDNDAA